MLIYNSGRAEHSDPRSVIYHKGKAYAHGCPNIPTSKLTSPWMCARDDLQNLQLDEREIFYIVS